MYAYVKNNCAFFYPSFIGNLEKILDLSYERMAPTPSIPMSNVMSAPISSSGIGGAAGYTNAANHTMNGMST